MATQIDQDAKRILRLLGNAPRNEYVEATQIATNSKLSPERVNDAMALLVDSEFVEWLQVMGTAPFDFGEAMITSRGRREIQRITAREEVVGDGGIVPDGSQKLQLFVSHASDDVELARRLVTLICVALNLPAAVVRCTSVDGYRLPGGINTNEQLRREVHESSAFIGIVSYSSLRSTYVLFELGARWGAGKSLVPLVAHNVPTSIMSGPLKGLNALRADSSSQLQQLIQELGQQLSITPQSPAVFDRALQDVVQTPPRANPLPSDASVSSSQSKSTPGVLSASTSEADQIDVGKGQAGVHPGTGVVIGVRNITQDRLVHLQLTFPGQAPFEVPAAHAGTIWTFKAHGDSYRMILRKADWTRDLTSFQIERDPASFD